MVNDLFLSAVMNGGATGIGIVIANWIGEKYIKPRLDKTHNRLFPKREEKDGL